MAGVGFGEKLVVHRKMQRAQETGEPLRLPRGTPRLASDYVCCPRACTLP